MFLLDTDHLTLLQWRSDPETGRILARIAEHPRLMFRVSIVSFHEQTLGWNDFIRRAKTPARIARGYAMLDGLLRNFTALQVEPFDQKAAELFDSLRAQGVRIGTMDLRIASIALAGGMKVVTRNMRDFRDVPGLEVEDWTLPWP
jgi:tRNA(fMet)-specific endonuclease VapC